MDIFDILSVQTFWKILLFFHFLMAVALLGAITLQAVAILIPVRQAAGNVINRFSPLPAASYATMIVALYVPQALMGAWIYLKYRTYVRIPMEGLRHWWTLGSFEFKEHVVTMGLAVLPAYWYFWRRPLSQEQAGVRKAMTIFLTFIIWYSFIIGHIANDFRGVGS
jgi:hypothetical protein